MCQKSSAHVDGGRRRVSHAQTREQGPPSTLAESFLISFEKRRLILMTGEVLMLMTSDIRLDVLDLREDPLSLEPVRGLIFLMASCAESFQMFLEP